MKEASKARRLHKQGNNGQAKDGAGFAARDVVLDWEPQHAVCPMGKTSNWWTPAVNWFKHAVITITCAMTDGHMCPVREPWTQATPPRRTMTIRPRAHHKALRAGRQREPTTQ